MGSRLNYAKGLDFEGSIAANGNPKLWIEGGVTIDELSLVTNLAADEFSLLIEVNGERRVEISGQEMLDREEYDGRAAAAGEYVLAMSDALARTLQGEQMSGLCTKPSDRVLISLEIGATVDAASPTALLYLETSAFRPELFRLYILPELVPVTKIGENPFSGMRKGMRPGANWIRRVFGYGAVTHLEVEQDRRSVFGKRGLPKAVNDARLKRNGKTVPSACFVFDPIVKGSVITDMFDTYSVEWLRFNFTTSDSNDIRALTEYVADLRTLQQQQAA